MKRLTKLLLPGTLTLGLFLGLTTAVQAAEIKGKIKSIDTAASNLVIQGVDGQEKTIHCERKVSLDGKEVQLSDLKPGDHALIVYYNDNAQTVRATRRFLDTFRDMLEPVTTKLPADAQNRLDTDGGFIGAAVGILALLMFGLILIVACFQAMSARKKRAAMLQQAPTRA